MMAQFKTPTVEIVSRFPDEYKFVREKYPAARRAIGSDTFKRIVAFNIPGTKAKTLSEIQHETAIYLNANRPALTEQLAAKKRKYKGIWRKSGGKFFEEISRITKLHWRHATYRIHLTASCFWGGDYDEKAADIYVNPLLKQGDPFYVMCHELSHLHFWEYIHAKYPESFIMRHHAKLWALSEIMVNYPFHQSKLFRHFPVVIPPGVAGGTRIVADFSRRSYFEIIDREIKKLAR